MTARIRNSRRAAALTAAASLAMLAGTVTAASAGPLQSEWANGYNSRVRLLAGAESGPHIGASAAADAGADRSAPSRRRLVAGVEIETKPDWKTYWRNPGDAGVPPAFDWSKSVNVAAAEVRYPAPQRLVDKSGITIGYLGGVVFPVMVTPVDPAKPVTLKLTIDYGVCKDICVPAQAELSIDIAAAYTEPVPALLAAALDRLPSARGQERTGDPVIKAVAVELAGTPPRLTLDVLPPKGTSAEAIDAFLVTGEGGFMPLPTRAAAPSKDLVRLIVDLSRDVDIADLRGKTVFVTVSGPGGASEAVITIK